MKNLCVFLPLLMSTAFACAQSTASPSPASIRVEFDRRVKMRDGVALTADIYRPVDSAKHPVLLVRTPYDKASEGETCRDAAQHGYVCVAQDTRGRYGSGGTWYPFKNEADDGYDSVEWAAALPYSDGRVGMFGESYVGATQWLAAAAHPPHLVAIQPTQTASDYHDGWVYQGGALELWFDQTWTSILASETMRSNALKNIPAMAWTQQLPETKFSVLQPDSPTKLAPYYFDWLSHPDYDSYWNRLSIEEHYPSLDLPARHVGGWYDIFLRGILRNYVGMRLHAATPSARDHQELIIGPWVHDADMDGKAGAVDFGKEAAYDRDATILEWYDEIFSKTGAFPKKRVKIFVMGINQWREEDDWPLPRTVYTLYYLNSSGHANSSAGDGTLNLGAPRNNVSTGQKSDAFTYDPANPVPTRGGNLCCAHDRVMQEPSGVFDQDEMEKRDDVLVFTTPAFEKDFEVTGPLTADVFVSSSAPDTDITAKLVDVWPNGFVQNLSDGIQRLRYRESADRADLMEPGKIYKVAIDIGATSNVFRTGHKLRLEISSSNFPRFDRNLNTEESPERGSKFTKAVNRIYHDAEHPSAIVLPVIPERQ